VSRIIRIDPWRQPYEYGGNRNGFTLRSSGSDGKSNTADYIILPGGSRWGRISLYVTLQIEVQQNC